MKRAIIFGASGFVGSHLLRELLSSPDYEEVIVFVRKDLGITHPKLRAYLGDYKTLPGLGVVITGDEIFIVLGTTRKATPNQADYYRLDHEYPLLAARLAKENGAKGCLPGLCCGRKSSFEFLLCKDQRRDRARYCRPWLRTRALLSAVDDPGTAGEKKSGGDDTDPSLGSDQPTPHGKSRSI